MRDILFRGKRVDNGEWVYGGYAHIYSNPNTDIIVIGRMCLYEDSDELTIEARNIDPSTIGQYTGLTDKNGKKIFEGDVVKVTGLYPDRDGEQRIWRQFRVGEVFYYHGAFFFGKWGLQKTSEKCIEIIGNIHDNPELLEVSE